MKATILKLLGENTKEIFMTYEDFLIKTQKGLNIKEKIELHQN